MKSIYFDMDGTLADLYGAPDWNRRLRAEEPGLFRSLEPMFPVDEFNELLGKLNRRGIVLGVITWLPIGATDDYELQATKDKLDWIDEFAPLLRHHFHSQPYGIPKQKAPIRRTRNMYLVDDNAKVGGIWRTPVQRQPIAVSKDYPVIDALRDLYRHL